MKVPFSAGAVLGDTFRTFFANFFSFALICLIVYSPTIVGGVILLQLPADMLLLGGLALGIMAMVLQPIAVGAVAYGVFQYVRGAPASVGDCLSVGFRRLLPVLGVSIVTGICIGVGMLLCLVPGFILMTIWAVAVPAAVIEGKGVGRSMSRSSHLTTNCRWPVFGVMLVFVVLSAAWELFVDYSPITAPYVQIGLSGVGSIVLGGVQACAPALIYYHLRRAKENTEIDEIAAVFD